MNLDQILQRLQDSITLVKKLIESAHKTDTDGDYVWSKDERTVVTEAAYLKLFKSWELFLEDSFQSYMIGTLSIAGNLVPTFVQPRNIEHAREMAIGTKFFVDWSSPDIVRKLSVIFFARDNPFEVILGSIFLDLNDMKTIRNAAAHLSSTTAAPLDGLSSRKLNRAITGTTVYDLILSINPELKGKTIIEGYTDILSSAAHQIANA